MIQTPNFAHRIKTPDWNYWRQIPQAKPWECVSLGCDIEPRFTDLRFLLVVSMGKVWEFPERLEIATAHLGPKGELTRIDLTTHNNQWGQQVCLKEFVKSARYLGWDLPDGFSQWPPTSIHTSPAELGKQGGKQRKYDTALQEFIGWVVTELRQIGRKGTLGEVWEWLNENAYSSSGFESPFPGCDDIYIDGKHLVWKNREGREKPVSFRSLERYIKRAHDITS